MLEFQVSVIMQEVKNGKQAWLPGCDLKRRNAYASMPELPSLTIQMMPVSAIIVECVFPNQKRKHYIMIWKDWKKPGR